MESNTNLNVECSLFRPWFSSKHQVWMPGTKPETVSIAEILKKPIQIDLLNKIRSAADKNEKSLLKQQLFAITPSCTQIGGRGEDFVKERNGLLAFDIDKLEGEYITKHQFPSIFNWVTKIPYTAYCGKSASGLGIWGLFKISNPDKHSEHFNAMEEAFKGLGISIDPAPKNIASLRYLAFDPDAYYNDQSLVFDKVIENQEPKRKPLSNEAINYTGNPSDCKDLIQKFNAECTAQDMYQILKNFGFKYHSTKGTRYRFTRPGKSTKAGLSVDYCSARRTLYCFSSEVPLLEYWKAENAGGWACSPVTALLLYGFGGMEKKHWAQAFNYLKNK